MKKPRFFCDNCGAKVDRDTKICPECGRFFAFVRCPKCGFTGTEGRFTSGCPSCGYTASGTPPANSPKPAKKKQQGSAETIPLWVYVLTTLAAICVFVILITVLR